MKRPLLLALLAAVMVLATAAPAFAGEWAPGQYKKTGDGSNGAPDHANSDCVFNGQDEPDELEEGDDDDFIWEQTPAKGRVQSGGQFIAAQAQGVDFGFPPEMTPFPGVQGFACNPTRAVNGPA